MVIHKSIDYINGNLESRKECRNAFAFVVFFSFEDNPVSSGVVFIQRKEFEDSTVFICRPKVAIISGLLSDLSIKHMKESANNSLGRDKYEFLLVEEFVQSTCHVGCIATELVV
jgi:hypothetical protein